MQIPNPASLQSQPAPSMGALPFLGDDEPETDALSELREWAKSPNLAGDDDFPASKLAAIGQRAQSNEPASGER